MELEQLFDTLQVDVTQEKIENFIELKTKVSELIERNTLLENEKLEIENQLIAERETVQRLSDTIAKHVKSIHVNTSDVAVKDNDIDYNKTFENLIDKMYI